MQWHDSALTFHCLRSFWCNILLGLYSGAVTIAFDFPYLLFCFISTLLFLLLLDSPCPSQMTFKGTGFFAPCFLSFFWESVRLRIAALSLLQMDLWPVSGCSHHCNSSWQFSVLPFYLKIWSLPSLHHFAPDTYFSLPISIVNVIFLSSI